MTGVTIEDLFSKGKSKEDVKARDTDQEAYKMVGGRTITRLYSVYGKYQACI